MMHKIEIIGILCSIGVMSLALFLLNTMGGATAPFAKIDSQSQLATVVDGKNTDNLKKVITDSMNYSGTVKKLIIEDVVEGVGDEVKVGDTVSVHYIGTLQSGVEFDNSNKRGEPFSFTVGEGRVIKGWEEGLVGMKVGGERILVIPSEKAYGASAVGPIPPNSTLVFSISLIKIN